jgi:hypothetical protein
MDEKHMGLRRCDVVNGGIPCRENRVVDRINMEIFSRLVAILWTSAAEGFSSWECRVLLSVGRRTVWYVAVYRWRYELCPSCSRLLENVAVCKRNALE